MSDLARLEAILRASPRVMTVLETVRNQELADWRLFSGAVYQTVWNAITGRDADYGIKDYDIGYFDPDTSWEAEDVVIKRVAAACSAPLDAMVEVRNQARVHLWFEARFGEPYDALPDTDAGLSRFLCPAFAVGVRLEPDRRMTIAAPFGLEDLFAMRLRPNPVRAVSAAGYAKVAQNACARWPEVVCG